MASKPALVLDGEATSSVIRGLNRSIEINGGGGGAVVPLCEDMCAEAERKRRIESDDLDKFENPRQE